MANIYEFEASTSTITSIDKEYEEDLVVPRQISGKDIKIIGSRACYAGNLTSLNLSETVIEHIREESFTHCKKIKSIELPKTLISIGQNAFAGARIASISLPASLKSVVGKAFNQCPNLNIITVDEESTSFVSINNCLFSKDLTELIRVPVNIKSYKAIPCFNCIQRLTVGPFSGCYLRSFVATSNLSYIGVDTFHACLDLVKLDLYSANVYTILISTVIYTTSITTLVLPLCLEEIKSNAFINLPKLKKLVIPSGVKTLENSAFQGLTSLENLYYLGNYSFESSSILNDLATTRQFQHVAAHVTNNYPSQTFCGYNISFDIENIFIKYLFSSKCLTLNKYRYRRRCNALETSIFLMILFVQS